MTDARDEDWDEEGYGYGYGPDDDFDECLHEDYDADWNGRAMCYRCGHTWWQTSEEIAREFNPSFARLEAGEHERGSA